MANLEGRADKAVRDAVDAFMDGRLVPKFEGEVVFETANSRYRLLDGVVFAAPDTSLIGAELVGWLSETARRCLIEWSWQPGSRAVLVDRKRGRNIIVTSTTRLLHQEEHARPPFQRESDAPDHDDSWPVPEPAPAVSVPVAAPNQPFSARHAAIIAATPEPAPVVVPAPASSAARRAPAVHAPPRPIASRPGLTPPAQMRPLPAPTAPRRAGPAVPAVASTPELQSPGPQSPEPPAVVAAPVGSRAAPPTAWELTSGEFEVEVDTTDHSTDEYPELGSPHHDASHQALRGLSAAERAEDADLMDPMNSEPFPLIRPAEPSGSSHAPPGAPRRGT